MTESEYNSWLEASGLDKEAAYSLVQSGQYNLSVFHCQQAVEKYLKALIAYSGKPVFSHSLLALAEETESRLAEKFPEGVTDCLRKLDMHYTLSRYPGIVSLTKLYDIKSAQEAVQWMETCLSYIKTLHLT